MDRVTGKVTIVIAAAEGIGNAIATALAGEGARPAVNPVVGNERRNRETNLPTLCRLLGSRPEKQ